MPVNIAHQIIQDIHSIVRLLIQPQALLNHIQIMILGIDLKCHFGNHGIFFGSDKNALGYFLPIIKSLFVFHLFKIKTLTDFTSQKLLFYNVLSAVL